MTRDTAIFWFWVVCAFIVIIIFSGCQSRDANNYYISAYEGGQVDIRPSGETDQDRGNNAERALSEPNVSVIP